MKVQPGKEASMYANVNEINCNNLVYVEFEGAPLEVTIFVASRSHLAHANPHIQPMAYDKYLQSATTAN